MVKAYPFGTAFGTINNPLSLYNSRLYVLFNKKFGSIKDLWNAETLEWDIQSRRPLRSWEL